MKNWSVHLCGRFSLDRECRKYGCERLGVLTPWGFLDVALNSASKFAVASGDGWVGRWVDWRRFPRL